MIDYRRGLETRSQHSDFGGHAVRARSARHAPDTAAALRLLEVLEECRQMSPTEAEKWRRRITGWAWFSAVGGETQPSA